MAHYDKLDPDSILSPAFGQELATMISERYFIQGQGFPIFEKSEAGEFLTSPDTQRLILKGYVDLGASDTEILKAIQDNFLVGEQYVVEWFDH